MQTLRAFSRIRLYTPRTCQVCARGPGRRAYWVPIRRSARDPCRVLGQQGWWQSPRLSNGSAAPWLRRGEPGTRDLALRERPRETRLATAQMPPSARRYLSAPGPASLQPARPQQRTPGARAGRSSFFCFWSCNPSNELRHTLKRKESVSLERTLETPIRGF